MDKKWIKTLLPYALILFAGIKGACDEIDKQKEDKEFNDYKNRVEALEKRFDNESL